MSTYPLFALPQVVILPGVVAPFHFFEPRYVQMIEDVVSNSMPPRFAMSLLLAKDEMDYYLQPKFKETGCIVEVIKHRKNDNNTHDVVVVGVERATMKSCDSVAHKLYRNISASPKPYSEIDDEIDHWLKENETELAYKLGDSDGVEEVYNRWEGGELSTRDLLNILSFFIEKDAYKVQEFIEEDYPDKQLRALRCSLL